MKPKYPLSELGKECSRFRDDFGMTYKEIALAAGVNENSFSEARRSERHYDDIRLKVTAYIANARAMNRQREA